MPKGIYRRTKRGKYKIIKKRIKKQVEKDIEKEIKRPNKFRRNVEDLRKFIEENDIKLLELLKYIRIRNHKKKVKNGISEELD